MTRQFSAFAAAGVLGLSAVLLTACGRTPTPVAVVAASTPDADEGDASLSAREEELAARERELREQQEALRREREQLATDRARTGNTVAGSDTAFDADETAVPAPGTASSIQKVPTLPIVVPLGTPLRIELAANVNTKVTRVGDRVDGRLAEDLVVEDRRAAIEGAAVSGKVTELVSGSNRIGGAPTLELTFDSLQAANGATVPIVARYVERGDSETAEDAAKVVGGAAAGAVIGHEVGEDDKGTVVGGILGGAAGAAAAQKTGGEVKLRAGTVITAPTETSFSIY